MLLLDPLFRSPGRAWATTLLYTAFLFMSLPVAPEVWGWLGERHLAVLALNFLIAAVLVLWAFYLFVRLKTRRLLRLALIVPLLAAYGYALSQLPYPPERFHFVEYGFLAFFLYRTVHLAASRWMACRYAMAIGFVVGMVDEGVQYFLPNRVFDPRDLAANGAAVALGLAVTLVISQRGLFESAETGLKS